MLVAELYHLKARLLVMVLRFPRHVDGLPLKSWAGCLLADIREELSALIEVDRQHPLRAARWQDRFLGVHRGGTHHQRKCQQTGVYTGEAGHVGDGVKSQEVTPGLVARDAQRFENLLFPVAGQGHAGRHATGEFKELQKIVSAIEAGSHTDIALVHDHTDRLLLLTQE